MNKYQATGVSSGQEAPKTASLSLTVLRVQHYCAYQRRYDMRHEMLTQRAPFCIGAMAKKGTLSQHFVTHVVPPLCAYSSVRKFNDVD